jgi:SAM-dependent methyltransferase
MDFEDKAKQWYTGECGKAYQDTKRSIPRKAYPWVAKLRMEKISPYVRPDDCVLEYGVGTGWNLAQLNCKQKLGFDVYERLESVVGDHGIEFIKDINTVPHESVDVVVCHHVLEHVPVPHQVLKEIGRLLCPDGKLLLFVPFEKEKRYRYYDPMEPNHHLYSWNVQTSGNLVGEVGFRVEKAGVGRFGYDRFAAAWAECLHLNEPAFRLIRRLVHLIAPAMEVRIVARKT